jgi:NAD(P)-dependent dehydrogenase (short-subunit alcohol dehydrogenase family)
MSNLTEKVALITGGSRGIGAGIAKRLAADGAAVVITYAKDAKAASAVVKAIEQDGGKALAIQADAADVEALRAAVEKTVATFGRLDVLVNNAGTTKHVPHDNLDGLSAEDFQRLFGVNTIGPFQMVRAARSLLEAGAKASGRASCVVNVSSVAGISGIGSSVAYAASKGALNTITLSLARALAPLIRVNTVCPGYIDTPWFTKGRGVEGAAKVRDSVVSKVPLKRASTAEDVANVVCFLALPRSGNMTGEIVRIDAGAHLIT